MSSSLRVVFVLALVVIVVGVVRVIGRWQRPTHPSVDLEGFGPRPGVVVFTSTDCDTCAETMRMVDRTGVAIREVTWELEPQLFERYAIEAVPLVIVLDAEGRSILFETGTPDVARLGKALRKAVIG
jgi:glutaredoxin